MSSQDDSAFPQTRESVSSLCNSGITKLEYFAARAPAIPTRFDCPDHEPRPKELDSSGKEWLHKSEKHRQDLRDWESRQEIHRLVSWRLAYAVAMCWALDARSEGKS